MTCTMITGSVREPVKFGRLRAEPAIMGAASR
jgi:hypothetical protein